MAEFACNCYVNRTTDFGPFEIVTGFKPTQPIDLVLIPHHHSRVSDSASAFTFHIHTLHDNHRKK